MNGIATRLKCALGDTGFTQKELAQMTGLTEVSISRYVNGNRVPKATTLARIADALGVGMGYFFDSVAKDTNVPSTDCISRQAALEVIDAVFPVDPMKSEYAQGIACGAALAKTYVEQLPSARPEIIRCTECKHYREYDSEYVENAVVVQCMADRYPISEIIPDGWFCAGAERKDNG